MKRMVRTDTSKSVRTVLLHGTAAILKDWQQRLEHLYPEEMRGYGGATLRDSLPQIIAVLAEMVEEADSTSRDKMLREIGKAHAELRVDLEEFSLSVVIREYGLFREALFAYLEQEQVDLPHVSREAINRAIDYSIDVVVQEYLRLSTSRTELLETARSDLNKEIAQIQLRQEVVLDQLPVGVILAECPSGRILYHNRLGGELFGQPETTGEIVDYLQYGAQHPDGTPYEPEEHPLVRAARHGETVLNEELRYQNAEGELRWMTVNATPLKVNGDQPRVAVAVFWDVEEVKALTRRMAKDKEFAEITLRSISDGVITVDRDGSVVAMNPAAERLLRWTQADAQKESLADAISIEEDSENEALPFPVRACIDENRVIEYRPFIHLQDRQGIRRAFSVTLAPMHDEKNVIGAVIILHDASHERRMWRQMARDAAQDPLTGLLNRREFERRLKRTVHAAQRDGANATLLMLDLDQFKPINDECGHAAGDLMLRELANLMQMQVRDRDTLARLGGDEFAVILEHCPVERGLVVANSIRESVRTFEFFCHGKVFSVGVSVGVAPILSATRSTSEALKRADEACYAAKEGGRNRVCLARDGEAPQMMEANADDSPALVESALRENRFVLYGQRIRALSLPERAENDGIEVLLRLCLSDGKMLTPDHFLPTAERYDLMPEIDVWVVENVLEALHRHPDAYDHFSICSVNLSGQTLANNDAMNRIFAVLETWPLAASRLAFEIAEAAALKDLTRTEQVANHLRSLGCRLVLQEAGVSLMSLRQLRALPVDFLKLEQEWTGEDESSQGYDVVKAVNELCHALGKQTMAVRVDNRQVLEGLQRMGVDYVQGELLEEPRNLDALLSHHGLH